MTPHIDRRTFGTSAILVAAGGLLAACSSSSSPSASSTATPSSTPSVDLSSVTLNVGDQKGTGAEAVLTAAGLLSTLPFKVSWSDFTSGPPIMEAAASGSVDVGGVGDLPPVFAAAGGEAITIVGARVAVNGDQDAILVPKGSSITSISELKGKKIAYGSGSSANYQLLTVLKKAGLTTKDVTLVNLQPAEALAAFTSGDVDAWGIWPPYVQYAQSLGATVIATGSDYGNPYSFQVASKAAVADTSKAAALKVYLATLNKAYAWTANNTNAWATAWAKVAGYSISVMDKAAAIDKQTPVAIDSSVISSEQNLVDVCYAAGLIPSKIDITDYITTQFNDTVS
ncbi:MAG: ABC transporter substrate-binding protein [Streptosporangiaceae bacterium]